MTKDELIKKIQYFEEEMSNAPSDNIAKWLSPLLTWITRSKNKSVKNKMKDMYEELLADLARIESTMPALEAIGLKRRIKAAYNS